LQCPNVLVYACRSRLLSPLILFIGFVFVPMIFAIRYSLYN
jgi:hypothetical protein